MQALVLAFVCVCMRVCACALPLIFFKQSITIGNQNLYQISPMLDEALEAFDVDEVVKVALLGEMYKVSIV